MCVAVFSFLNSSLLVTLVKTYGATTARILISGEIPFTWFAAVIIFIVADNLDLLPLKGIGQQLGLPCPAPLNQISSQHSFASSLSLIFSVPALPPLDLALSRCAQLRSAPAVLVLGQTASSAADSLVRCGPRPLSCPSPMSLGGRAA
jgi:hypothetical protein